MGLIKDKIYYTYEDLTIMPNIISGIEHRSECIPLDDDGMLPIFTAPMNTVVDEKNFDLFEKEMIHAILPRTVDISLRVENSTKGRWSAYSLTEFENVFCDETNVLNQGNGIKALIDIANGHMKKSIDLVRAAKNIYGENIKIMVGNIANPRTYEEYTRAGVDFIRAGIGAGNGCLSTSNVAVHTPMASLIDEIVSVRKEIEGMYPKLPKIIADGGIRNYRDIIKALALGADYVMIGSVFARMLESSADKCAVLNGIEVGLGDIDDLHLENDEWYGNVRGKKVRFDKIVATFYGMASREGQIALNGAKTKTSEGLLKKLDVKYTMHGWSMNIMDYLRSAMSYVGVKTLEDFKKYTNVIINSSNSVAAVNK